ncbi:MAG: DUF3656 domain-containing protein [Lachnospiraceae bacterium]|nr:DUF3656 domain-containing protein [Lachnospiraceae bacterium]
MMELLAPAGSFDSLKAAVTAGADAVYIGGRNFGARAYADNPDQELLLRGIDYCHLHRRALYLTVNTLLKEQELEGQLYDYLLPYYKEGLDGVIVQDFGVMRFIQKNFPLLPVHGSTQMTITGVDGARFLKKQGVKRVVTARELSLEEIREIIDQTGLEVETFVHGAMCCSYSGQCLFSSMIGGRSGNRGRCAQPCRLPYTLSCHGKALVSQPQYLMSLKDMCAVDLLPELVQAGIASLKIEGRMKRPEYTAGVVSIYRKYLDQIESGDMHVRISSEDRRKLLDLYSRGGFSQGYYHTAKGPSMMTVNRPNHLGSEAARMEKRKNSEKGLYGKALCVLSRGDILEAVPDRPGQKGQEVTITGDVACGGRFPLPVSFSKVSSGSLLHRTRNQKLLDSVRDTCILSEYKEKIKGKLIVSPEKPVILEVSCGSMTVTAEGAIVQKAQKRPLSKEEMNRQLNKTGDSPFLFETLAIEMEGEVFLPLQALNQLRREALSQLEEKICKSFFREEPVKENLNKLMLKEESYQMETVSRFYLTVAVKNRSQLDAVLAWSAAQDSRNSAVEVIYLDVAMLFPPQAEEDDFAAAKDFIARVQSAGILCMVQMPPIFRKKDRRFYTRQQVRDILTRADGFLVRTVDAFAFLQSEGYRQPIIGDEGLYAYNCEAAAFWKNAGIFRQTLPAELNVSELNRLGCRGCELTIYGRVPLMFTAQCLKMNTAGCTGIPDTMMLKDRRQACFPVMTRCRECCNVIYNSVPLDLMGCGSELKKLHPSHLRLSFTTETEGEVSEILNRYDLFLKGQTDGKGTDSTTRGHFRRGVE